MKLYLISRTDRVDYDEFDSFVVAAKSEGDALSCSPSKYNYGWTTQNNLTVECIGESNSQVEKVIIASFNAG